MSHPDAASSVTALVRLELAAEQARKSSLEQRGIAVITSSGTLVALVFAIGTITQGGRITVAGNTRVALFVALYAFILAAVAGIIANWPWKIGAVPVAEPGGLQDLVTENIFRGPEASVDRRVAETQVSQIGLLRAANRKKVGALLVGLTLEVIAISSVALVITFPLM